MKRLLLSLLLLCGAAGAPALAAPPVPVPSGGELVPAAGFRIDVSMNQGQLVRLAKPVDSVFVADPTIADVQVKSPTLIYVVGKAAGTTTLYAVTQQDDVILNTQVRVNFDASRVAETIRALVPQSDIAVNAVGDSLVLAGTVYSASEGDDVRRIAARFVKDPKQLVDQMKLDAPNQVNLRVQLAEVSRTIAKEFGIDWTAAGNAGKFSFGLVTSLSTLGGLNTITNKYVSGPNNTANLSSVINALDNNGLTKILAEPDLTAISGQPASFLAGGEFPVPIPAGQGLVGIEFKNFGVSLNFVATILGDNRISLHVAPEVSELSTEGAIQIDGISVPSLTTRRAETTVELGSGQTFAIAGLLQNNVTQNINKFPWLGDVPVLGQLFRDEAFQRDETELVILVTPYIVHPIETASRAMTPTAGFVPSTDTQLVVHGAEYQQQPPPAAPAPTGASKLIGPVGFDLE
jgi:pilus assembly protein CpaC